MRLRPLACGGRCVRTSSLPGSRTDVTPIDSSCSPVKSSPTCMWQSHRPGISVLPRPSITCAPAGTVDRRAAADGGDHALVDDHRLVGQEPRCVGVEEPDAGERNRSRRCRDQRL